MTDNQYQILTLERIIHSQKQFKNNLSYDKG